MADSTTSTTLLMTVNEQQWLPVVGLYRFDVASAAPPCLQVGNTKWFAASALLRFCDSGKFLFDHAFAVCRVPNPPKSNRYRNRYKRRPQERRSGGKGSFTVLRVSTPRVQTGILFVCFYLWCYLHVVYLSWRISILRGKDEPTGGKQVCAFVRLCRSYSQLELRTA